MGLQLSAVNTRQERNEKEKKCTFTFEAIMEDEGHYLEVFFYKERDIP